LTEKLRFAVENVELIEESNDSQFATLKIDAFASGNNRHSLYVSEDTLRKTAKTILEKPIIWEYSRAKDDATTHSDNQIICGFIPKDSPIEFKELEDSRIMMSIVGKLWVRYAGKMTDIFKRDKSKSVSVEMEVLEENETSNFGIPELLSYCYQGITVLGESVLPAIRNAKADLVAFASKEQEEYLRAYELEFSNKYADIDFTIPKKVKSSAQKSLDTYKEKGNNATSISLAMGRFLAKNEKATIEKLRMMAKFFNRKILPDDITLGFFGGKEGARWCKEIMSAVDEIDSRQLSYFGEDDVITFPYKSIGEINPALKGIDPPISLAQANAIASQADAIGTDEDKNGWAIAISSFKKTHIVKDGKWVKKEKNMEDEKDLKKPEEDMAAPPEGKEEEMAAESKDETPEKKEEEMAADSKKEEDKEKEPDKEPEGKEDAPSKEDKENKEEKMSLDGNLDVAALLAFLESETEANEEMVAKYKTDTGDLNHAMIHQASFAKMCKMAEDLKKAQEDKDVYMAEKDAQMAEFEELKKFKADMEAKQFAFEVESTITEISETMPKDKIDAAREDSKNFSLNNVDAWKNKYKAEAFSYSKDKKPSDGIMRMAIPWVTTDKKSEDAGGWVS